MSKKSKTFEESMGRLEQIVRAMERGDVPLEESLKLCQAAGMKPKDASLKLCKNRKQEMGIASRLIQLLTNSIEKLMEAL